MAANSDGSICEQLTTILTCEGDLNDPGFPTQLNQVVGSLNGILGGEVVKVRKLEPWNSVRVTLSIPREAALRLRQLATEGSQQLRALGILSVQVEGDQVISLRLATNSIDSNPQEIILRTAQDGSSGESDLGLSKFLSTATGSGSSSSATSGPSTSVTPSSVAAAAATSAQPAAISASVSAVGGGSGSGSSGSGQVQFKSPNVVCPPDSVVPKVGSNLISGSPINTVGNSGKVYNGPPFPFASMNQAIHSNRNETNNNNNNNNSNSGGNNSNIPFNSLPPPYPGKPAQPVTISSPLLVNLLQNEGGSGGVINKEQLNSNDSVVQTQTVQKAAIIASARSLRTSIEQQQQQQQTVHKPITVPVSVPPIAAPSTLSTLVKQQQQQQQQPPNLVSTQANLLVNNSISPSALSTNTSINKQNNSTILTSTTVISTPAPPPSSAQTLPPQYHRPNPTVLSVQHQSVPQQAQQIGMNISSMQASTSSTMSQQHTNQLSHTNNSVTQSSIQQIHHTLSQTSLLHSQMNQSAVIGSGTTGAVNISNLVQAKTISQQAKLNCVQQPIMAAQSNSGHHMYLGTPQPQPPPTNNIINRNLPSPPPYSVAISRPWDTLVNTTPLLDLTPTLTDLKPDDLDELLPTLERELTHSPLPDLGDDLTSLTTNDTTNQQQQQDDKRKFLINPLTGELEPHSSEESDGMEELNDVFTGLPSPAALSDDDTNSTIRPDTTTDQSDTETTRNNNETTKVTRLKNNKVRETRGRDSPTTATTTSVIGNKPITEKIKLRLKLEKSEPINPAYKVDISFIKNTQPKNASTSLITPTIGAITTTTTAATTVATTIATTTTTASVSEELRVPPLHISLRGRNSIVIKNKTKLNPDGTPMKAKMRKNQEHLKRKSDTNSIIGNNDEIVNDFDNKKLKKFKSNQEHISNLSQESDLKSKLLIHSHYNKDKQKERRGSDSELVKKKCIDTNGVLNDEKKHHQRRLSQTEQIDSDLLQPTVLGSTNVGTIMGLPQKLRKDKIKIKDGLKTKDLTRNKLYAKNEKNSPKQQQQQQQVALPTAGEIDMEAKFKQGLLEGSGGEKGISRPPHRTTEIVHHLITETNNKIVDQTIIKEQREPDKCNTPDKKSSTTTTTTTTTTAELNDKQNNIVVVNSGSGNRSPNSGSSSSGNNQGEDSGIESMDALSEKSPNQASQSPHADIVIPPNNNKQQVPDMLDIEAQLAKMEGLNGDTDRGGGGDGVVVDDSGSVGGDGVNSGNGDDNNVENTSIQQQQTKSTNNQQHDKNLNSSTATSSTTTSTTLNKCCELTCALQDSLKQGTVTLTATTQQHSPVQASQIEQEPDVSLVSIKSKKEEDLDPLPLRVTPALYTYSNPDKVSRGGSESPSLSDEDSYPYENTSMTTTTTTTTSTTTTSSSSSPVVTTSIITSQQHTTTTATTITHNSNNKSKSLLEQLLIEIPNDHHQNTVASSPSPATRSSVKTRALSKLNSPELNSSVMKNIRSNTNNIQTTTPTTTSTTTTTSTNLIQSTTKRKRNESDSSSHSIEEVGRNKKTRKCSENAAELIKACMGVDGNKLNNINKKITQINVGKLQQDESSDSDEPLIEKVRKTPSTQSTNNSNNVITTTTKTTKLKGGTGGANAANNNKTIVGTRRSVRTNMPAQNTRSKVEKEASEAIRRKTRSAVSDVENKRKRELK